MGMQRGGEFLGQWVAHVYIPAGRRWTTDERDQPVARTGDLDVRAVTSLHIGIKIKGEVVVPDEWVVEEEPGDGTAGLSRQREAGAGEVVVCRESVPAPADESSAGDLPGWQPGEDAGDEVVVEPGEVVPSRHLKTDLAALRTQEHRFILGTGGGQAHRCVLRTGAGDKKAPGAAGLRKRQNTTAPLRRDRSRIRSPPPPRVRLLPRLLIKHFITQIAPKPSRTPRLITGEGTHFDQWRIWDWLLVVCFSFFF
jgi:hypothetical protein